MNDTFVDAEERFRAATPVIELVVGLVATWAANQGIAVRDPLQTCELAWGIEFILGI
jgi:hypothetical protein